MRRRWRAPSAVLGDDADLRHVVALSGRAPERVAAAADALAASDILRPVDAGALRFAHPLLASAVYADIATAERSALHRRAAEILHGEPVAPERVAAHLLPSPGSGEAWVVEVLRAVARARAGAAARPSRPRAICAVRCRSRPPPAVRAAVLRELGVAEAATGLPSAIGRLEEAVAAGGWQFDGATGGGDDRARALLELGRALAAAGRYREAIERFDAAAGCADAAPAVAAQARAEAGTLGLLDPARRGVLLAGDGVAAAHGMAARRLRRRSARCVACTARWPARRARRCSGWPVRPRRRTACPSTPSRARARPRCWRRASRCRPTTSCCGASAR